MCAVWDLMNTFGSKKDKELQRDEMRTERIFGGVHAEIYIDRRNCLHIHSGLLRTRTLISIHFRSLTYFLNQPINTGTTTCSWILPLWTENRIVSHKINWWNHSRFYSRSKNSRTAKTSHGRDQNLGRQCCGQPCIHLYMLFPSLNVGKLNFTRMS